MDLIWHETNSYLMAYYTNLKKLPQPLRIAGFDLDDTLIHRPRGKKNDGKWKLINTEISDKICELVEQRYIIVIFTNQSGMGSGKNFDKLKWREAVDELAEIMFKKIQKNEHYYFSIYVAKKYDLYRKPNTGLWELLKYDLREQFGMEKIEISKKSFYCGDAAGRTEESIYHKKLYPSSKKKGDFNDTDRKFALNLRINFITPEEFYMEESPEEPYKLFGFDPYKFIERLSDDSIKSDYKFKPRSKELIMMVGVPGSGKSYFAKKYIVPENYVYISQDVCKTTSKCLIIAESSMKKGKNIVIDNTNPDVVSRMKYTSMAKDYGYKHIRCIIMNTDLALAKHLNNVRHIYSRGDIPKINDIVYAIFKKNYVYPQKSEHFDKIEEVEFSFDASLLEDPMWKKYFLKWSEA